MHDACRAVTTGSDNWRSTSLPARLRQQQHTTCHACERCSCRWNRPTPPACCPCLPPCAPLPCQAMSEDYPDSDGDDDSFGGGSGDEQEDKELLVECGQRQVGGFCGCWGCWLGLNAVFGLQLLQIPTPSTLRLVSCAMQRSLILVRLHMHAYFHSAHSQLHCHACCLPATATAHQGAWSRYEEELERAEAEKQQAQALSMEQGLASKRQIFSK